MKISNLILIALLSLAFGTGRVLAGGETSRTREIEKRFGIEFKGEKEYQEGGKSVKRWVFLKDTSLLPFRLNSFAFLVPANATDKQVMDCFASASFTFGYCDSLLEAAIASGELHQGPKAAPSPSPPAGTIYF